ncbi:tyrosinase [Podospora fimiseda]|uniref:tyrosinase n=1 Tax=Podospora fimiseda TaxID=252190 RepID=A0AAN6YLZ4_9PEZI|nr:tyrosinase [Podospora fimiseda]
MDSIKIGIPTFDPPPGTQLRKDIELLSDQELDTLITAFDYIQKLPTNNPDSFFQIAGYHGMPFRGAGWGNSTWWGGYCNHGNILFPTWHRAYLLRLEEALRTAPGCADFRIPFWNQLKKDTNDTNTKWLYKGEPPKVFLARKWTWLTGPDKGKQIDNPLFSYKLGKSIVDNTTRSNDPLNYTKKMNYETVRYPFSGLVGDAAKAKTEIHNAELYELGDEATNEILVENVLNWLNLDKINNYEANQFNAGVGHDLETCIDAPNYTVFSNTTSAKAWNDDHMDIQNFKAVVSLEQPHNKIHLAVGGFEAPTQSNYNKYPGANGDMGENDTASFDPIFFFHHCWIDNMFWQWQTDKHATEQLDIKYAQNVGPDYPGTNSVDSQGPTPGTPANVRLTLDSPLDPFTKEVNGEQVPKTSRDVTDITKLGYFYAPIQIRHGSAWAPEKFGVKNIQTLSVSGANRGKINGSFVISTWAEDKITKKQVLAGVEAVLSRWNVSGCSNCQNHLEAGGHVSIPGLDKKTLDKYDFIAKVHTRDVPEGMVDDELKIIVGADGPEDKTSL